MRICNNTAKSMNNYNTAKIMRNCNTTHRYEESPTVVSGGFGVWIKQVWNCTSNFITNI